MVKRSHNQLNEDEAHMRFIVASEQAEKLLIKKQQSLRELSKSLCIKIKFSPFINTHTDRVMSITGTPENIGSTIGSLVRTWTGNNDDSSAQFTIQMIIPEPMVAKIVGFKGYGLRKLHRKSGAAIEAIKDGLPDSTDRLFTATGVADSLHRAVYFTSLIFQEYTGLLKRFEQESSPYEPRDNINPLRRRITGTYIPLIPLHILLVVKRKRLKLNTSTLWRSLPVLAPISLWLLVGRVKLCLLHALKWKIYPKSRLKLFLAPLLLKPSTNSHQRDSNRLLRPLYC